MTKKGKTTGAAKRPKADKPKKEPYISFNKAETAALQGVCLRSLRVYFELKWLGNFKTGVVGAFDRQKLTYEAIADRVAIPTSQGRSAAGNTIDGKEVARIIQRLADAGLVTDVINSGEGLTLWLPLSPIRSVEATEPEEDTAQEQQMPAAVQEKLASPEPSLATMPKTQEEPAEEVEDEWGRDEPKTAVCAAIVPPSNGVEVEKLPTAHRPEYPVSHCNYKDFSVSSKESSVLIKTEGQYNFSVPESVLDASARSALADVGKAGAPNAPHWETGRLTAAPCRGGNPNLDAGQIKERIRTLYPQFSYLDTQVSAAFFQRAAGLDVTSAELDEAARSLVDDPMQKLTAGALFDRLVARRRRPRRLAGGLVL